MVRLADDALLITPILSVVKALNGNVDGILSNSTFKTAADNNLSGRFTQLGSGSPPAELLPWFIYKFP